MKGTLSYFDCFLLLPLPCRRDFFTNLTNVCPFPSFIVRDIYLTLGPLKNACVVPANTTREESYTILICVWLKDFLRRPLVFCSCTNHVIQPSDNVQQSAKKKKKKLQHRVTSTERIMFKLGTRQKVFIQLKFWSGGCLCMKIEGRWSEV